MTLLRVLTPVVLLLSFVFAVYTPYRLVNDGEKNIEVNRLLRIELQHAKQVQALLKSRSTEDAVEPTVQGVDVLKISLIEKMLEDSWPQGVSDVEYEFQKTPGSNLSYAGHYLVSVRVVVNFTTEHSLALIRYLDFLMLAVHPQPIEIRACENRKDVTKGLRNQCVLDFHYWVAPHEI